MMPVDADLTDPDWVTAQSVEILVQDIDWDTHDVGQIIIEPLDVGWRIAVGRRPHLMPEDAARFREIVYECVYSLLKNGPLPGVWFPRTAAPGWKVTIRARPGEAFPADHIPDDWTT